VLNRVSWGANASSARALASVGAERYLERQLHPGAADELPPAAQAQIDALSVTRQPLEELASEADQQQKAVNAITDPELKQAAQRVYQERLNRFGREAVTRALLRDLYAPAQLREQLVWFWFNHFNVHLYKANIRVLIGDYEEKAIRPHALGRFRDLLRATLRHPAMLRYLDNDQNAAGHINENYAREIMELHTMGVGSGYSQTDVQELARILTGLGVAQPANPPKIKPELQDQYVRAGLFEFNPNRHDYGDKVFLGRAIKGTGLKETEEALDILARAPATARFISRKLALYFVSDSPPQPLIDAMAETFRSTDGDIAAVLKTMFQSPAFTSSLGARFKDPMHFVISALRLAYDDKVVLNIGPVQGWLGRLAQRSTARKRPMAIRRMTEAGTARARWRRASRSRARSAPTRAACSRSRGHLQANSRRSRWWRTRCSSPASLRRSPSRRSRRSAWQVPRRSGTRCFSPRLNSCAVKARWN